MNSQLSIQIKQQQEQQLVLSLGYNFFNSVTELQQFGQHKEYNYGLYRSFSVYQLHMYLLCYSKVKRYLLKEKNILIFVVLCTVFLFSSQYFQNYFLSPHFLRSTFTTDHQIILTAAIVCLRTGGVLLILIIKPQLHK